MAVRTMASDEEAYALLRGARRPDESFSRTVKRLARPRQGISDLGGAREKVPVSERWEMSRLPSAMAEGDRRRGELIWKTRE